MLAASTKNSYTSNRERIRIGNGADENVTIDMLDKVFNVYTVYRMDELKFALPMQIDNENRPSREKGKKKQRRNE